MNPYKCVLAFAVTLAAGAAAAEERPVPANPPADVWQQECAACHLAFPPYMLPSKSWKQLMQELNRHFDTDASLSDQETQSISRYLLKYAGNDKYFDGVPLRITQTSRFRQEHDAIEPSVIRREAVKSLANCKACHPGAERESFEEAELKIPD